MRYVAQAVVILLSVVAFFNLIGVFYDIAIGWGWHKEFAGVIAFAASWASGIPFTIFCCAAIEQRRRR